MYPKAQKQTSQSQYNHKIGNTMYTSKFLFGVGKKLQLGGKGQLAQRFLFKGFFFETRLSTNTLSSHKYKHKRKH